MQNPMKDHAMDLIFKENAHFPGVIFNPVRANIDLALDRLAGIGKIEADYVSIEIMLQVLPVD
jgi:hypothetical protein